MDKAKISTQFSTTIMYLLHFYPHNFKISYPNDCSLQISEEHCYNINFVFEWQYQVDENIFQMIRNNISLPATPQNQKLRN